MPTNRRKYQDGHHLQPFQEMVGLPHQHPIGNSTTLPTTEIPRGKTDPQQNDGEEKRACWAKFITEQGDKDPWLVAKVARDPFHLRRYMGDLTDAQGNLLITNQDKVKGITEQHLVWVPGDPNQPPPHPSPPVTPQPPHIINQVKDVLKKTKNYSSPGPDSISYRILKLLADTPLGKAILNDIATTILRPGYKAIPVPPQYHQMKMVMIPKPGKDHTRVKG